jgi:hypothetical protein
MGPANCNQPLHVFWLSPWACPDKQPKRQDQLRVPRLGHVWMSMPRTALEPLDISRQPARSAVLDGGWDPRLPQVGRVEHRSLAGCEPAQSRLRAASRRQGAVAGPSIATDECYSSLR